MADFKLTRLCAREMRNLAFWSAYIRISCMAIDVVMGCNTWRKANKFIFVNKRLQIFDRNLGAKRLVLPLIYFLRCFSPKFCIFSKTFFDEKKIFPQANI